MCTPNSIPIPTKVMLLLNLVGPMLIRECFNFFGKMKAPNPPPTHPPTHPFFNQFFSFIPNGYLPSIIPKKKMKKNKILKQVLMLIDKV
jgi:hypothetical protein